jgi:hypothetical protein
LIGSEEITTKKILKKKSKVVNKSKKAINKKIKYELKDIKEKEAIIQYYLKKNTSGVYSDELGLLLLELHQATKELTITYEALAKFDAERNSLASIKARMS